MNLFKELRIISLLIIFKYSYSHLIMDVNNLANDTHFTKVKILSCSDLFNNFSDYLFLDHVYFVQDETYYGIEYYIRTELPDADYFLPKTLFNVNKYDFKLYKYDIIYNYYTCGNSDNTLVFKDEEDNAIKFKLDSIFFLKPIDSYAQPPELKSAQKVINITSCDDFDKYVTEDNQTGLIIYKNKYQGIYFKQDIWPQSIVSVYQTSLKHGFYWKKYGAIYTRCRDGKLHYIYSNGNYNGYSYLPHLIFYKPESLSLENLKESLTLQLYSCKNFNKYWENDNNRINNYIYFSHSNGFNLSYFAIKYDKKNVKNYFNSIQVVKLIKCEESKHKDRLILNIGEAPKDEQYFNLDELFFYDRESPSTATEQHKDRVRKEIATNLKDQSPDSKTKSSKGLEMIDQVTHEQSKVIDEQDEEHKSIGAVPKSFSIPPY